MTAGQTALAPSVRPRYDGANIQTWIGFKQFLALAEEAVLGWFRDTGHGPHRLFHQYSLELAVIDCSAVLPAPLDVDDEVAATVTPLGDGRFRVSLTALHSDGNTAVLNSRITVALIGPAGAGPLPGEVGRAQPSVANPAASPFVPLPADHTVFRWTWRARYFHCHFSDRVQHSAYVRALEEVVDRFLADRGLSVGTVLSERGWIPVVSRVRVRLLADAHMEEDVHVTFAVTDVLKDVTWEGRMDCHVRRHDELVPVATARILHGYAVSRGPEAGQLAVLDSATLAALTR